MRYPASEKAEIIELVEQSQLPAKRVACARRWRAGAPIQNSLDFRRDMSRATPISRRGQVPQIGAAQPFHHKECGPMKAAKPKTIPRKKIVEKKKLKVLKKKKVSIGDKIDRIFADFDKPTSPGMAIAVSKAGKVVFRKGYGMADLDHNIANAPDTVFHAASLTKQFTAMAIMMLINDPSLATRPITLDTDVHTLIPELSGITKPITIGQMLHHISGIRDQWVLATMAGWRLSDDMVTRDDVMDRFVALSEDLNFDPGTKYSYSNTNYTIAAAIVKNVTNLSLSAFCDRHIFQPLGMTKTRIIETHGEIVKDRAYGYRKTPAGNWEVRMPNYDLTGPTNLQTTVNDLMLWDANFDTMTVGGAAALIAMQTKAPTSGDYGLGLFILKQSNINIVEHNGRDAGYRSHLIRFPDQKLSIALLSNLALPDALPTQTWTLVRKVANLYLGTSLSAPTGPAPPVTTPGPTPPNLVEFTGRFHSDELDVTYTLSLDANGTAVEAAREKYPQVGLSPLSDPRTFKMEAFSVVLPLVKITFYPEQGQIAGFYMDDISGGDQLSNFKFKKLP
jgi:CubicO group peptidase (beta-lactamase class C family)